jgi:hypothetical protein
MRQYANSVKHASKKSLSILIYLEHIALLFVRAERRVIYTLLADAGKVMCLTYEETVPQTDTGIQVE